MSTMARRISKCVNGDYRKSMLIARTEAHRVREKGFTDTSKELNEIMKDHDSEYRMVKIWRNMKDGAVRQTDDANHVKMEGQTVLADEKFKMAVSGATAECPGTSGIAAEDCNCRCFVEHKLMNDAEFFKATGRHFDKKAVDISDKNDIIRSIDVDDFEMMADGRNIDKEVSDTIINTIKAYEADGGMYISDVHFGDFYDETTGKRALFQVTANARGLTELNINDEVLGGRTIEELNKQIAANPRNIPQNLKEAIIHECGHAKAYYKKSVAEIRAMNDEIADKGVDGISKIAKMDGSECIAEVEVLLYRGSKIPKTAMDLYKRWVK